MLQQQQSQTLKEWVDAFELGPEDLDYLTHVLLEKETPLTTDDISLALLSRRLEQDTNHVHKQYSAPSMYLPRSLYTLGQELVFPILDYSQGRVVAIRDGSNPDQGSFKVIQVEFEGGTALEFACGLTDHVLNEQPDRDGADLYPSMGAQEQILAEFKTQLNPRIESQLLDTNDIVNQAGYWFPRDLLLEVNVGHLNLAEATLDIAGGGPMSTDQMLPQLDLPQDANTKLQAFSLNYALQGDERFDEVGPTGSMLWFLRRLAPPEILDPPHRLLYEPVSFSPDSLTTELRNLAREIDDELEDQSNGTETDSTVRLVLPFHHRWSGTLPLSSRIAHLFPTATISPRVRVTLVDGHSGEKVKGWVVLQERFIWGLGVWYEKYDVPAGAYLSVTRGETSGEVVVTFQRRLPVREWVRSATAENHRLRFSMTKRSITLEYADEVIVASNDLGMIEKIQMSLYEQGIQLEQIVLDVFQDLVKLTPQGTVHASTLYHAVNIIRRVPPAPIFAQLASRNCYQHVGDAYWRLDPGASTSTTKVTL